MAGAEDTIGAGDSPGAARSLDVPADATLTSGADRPPRSRSMEPPVPEAGTMVGRYVVLSKLGSGAMGVVLAAYDPELDRKVAIKLLKLRRGDRELARARLQREAQALAKLNHPNVVTVHDVGTHQGQVFVAMEFVAGRTLRQWRAEERRSWRELVAVLLDAGHGLAAAHRVGLVHRDFKPDNVMIGDDGRVRVMDFGLARAQDGEEIVGSEDEALERSPSIPSMPSMPSMPSNSPISLTRTGSLMGTPAYMSPEQFGSGAITAATDQYSFCVTLYEGLYGQRPTSGETVAELAYEVTRGEARPPPRSREVPAWLRRMLPRGLARAPEDRFADMEELLAELAAGEGRRRRRRWLAGAGVLALAIGSGVGAWRYELARAVDACEAEGQAIDEVWSAETRESLRAGLLQTRLGYSAAAAQVVPRLDEQTAAWRQHVTEACTRARVHETWDESTFERASWCFEERRLDIAALVSALREPGEQSVQWAIESAMEIPPVRACMDEVSLAAMPALPLRDKRDAIASLRRDLSKVRVLQRIGEPERGLELAREVRRVAEQLGWPPLLSMALTEEAVALKEMGSFSEAEAVGVEAYTIAAKSGAWDVAELTASELAFVVGAELGRPEDGRLWAEHAAVAIVHAGDPLGLREAFRLSNLGIVESNAGELERAEEHHRRALALWEGALGPDHLHVATALNALGTTQWTARDLDAAESSFEHALAIREATLGAEHPRVAVSLNNLGRVLESKGDLAGARRRVERALRISEQNLGPDHPRVATLSNNLGVLLRKSGEPEAARRRIVQAVEIFERSSPGSSTLADALHALGDLQRQLAELEGAEQSFRAALAIRRRTLEPDDPMVANSWWSLGDVLLRRGEAAAALEPLGQAWVVRSASDQPLQWRARVGFSIAQALWDAPEGDGRDRLRARRLARDARADYATAGARYERFRLDVERWMVEHPAPSSSDASP